MVLGAFLYKVFSWSFMGLIRSELKCFGIRIQKFFFCLFRSRTNYIRLENLIIKKLPEKNFHIEVKFLVIYIKAIICLCGSLINFVVVAVFINCSNVQQYHYSSHVCYNLGENLTSNKILVTCTLV